MSTDWLHMYHGICPQCHEYEFIGHGPLCVKCFAREFLDSLPDQDCTQEEAVAAARDAEKAAMAKKWGTGPK